MSADLRPLVEKVPGLHKQDADEWRFDCPVNPAHSAYYQPSQDALWCNGPCTEAGLVAGVTALAETVDREVNAPPICPKAVGPGAYSHDSQACVDCLDRRTWAREEAARRAAARSARGQPLPESVNLADLLAEPEEDTPFLVEGLWPLGAHVLLSAKAKAGKSTVRNNAIRSLVDGDPFLGCFDVPHPVHRVVVLDLELTRSTNRLWLRRQGIANTGAVDVIPMRGQAHTLARGWKERWAERLRGADVVVLDCLEPVLHALDLNANTEARKFLEDWTAMLTAAEVPSSLVLHHHGHGAERAKGDSGIIAWTDSMWDVVCEDPDDITKPRYFKAFGREVDVPEGRLDLDHETGHLRYVGGASRAIGKGARQTREGLDTLLRALLADHDRRVRAGEGVPSITSVLWPSKGVVERIAKAAGLTRDPARQAIEEAQDQGLLVASRGKGASHAQVFALSPPGMARAREVS